MKRLIKLSLATGTLLLSACNFYGQSSGIGVYDADGWTVLKPSDDSRIVYVSDSEGDDANDGLSPSSPRKTIEAGGALMRDGYPDHLLLKRGDTWIMGQGLGAFYSGRSAAEPMVVSWYGDQGDRPLVKAEGPFVWIQDQARSNLAFVGLELYAYKHDPNSPDYESENGVSGISMIAAGGENILIEDCKFNYMQMGAYTTGRGETGALKNLNFRRNICLHSWAGGSSIIHELRTRVQGIYISGADGIFIEENLFDHNGWDEQIKNAGATMFNHNIYMSTFNPNCNKIIVRGNILARASAHGLQLRSGGSVEDNLFVQNAINLNVGYHQSASFPGACALVKNNVFQEARLMDSTNVEYPRTASVRGIGEITIPAVIENNLFSNSINEAQFGIDRYDDKWGCGGELVRQNNIIYKWTVKSEMPDAAWPEPERDIGDYHRSLGKEATTVGFLLEARKRPLKTWWPDYSAARVNAFIRNGFIQDSTTELAGRSQKESYSIITIDQYRDKMKGAWMGQMAGVGWGLPTEFDFIDVIIPGNKVPSWETGMINQQGNDDLYVEMTFLSSMEKYGTDVESKQAGIDFANTGYGLWAANRTGRENLRSGMAPPESGHPLHNPNCEDIDYQIESDYSGIIAPGMPNVAIRLGEKFGRIMNYGDGVYGGQFVGGMYTAAYFTDDMDEIIREGLKCIPPESNYAKCISDVVNWHSEYPDDWEKCWEEIMNKYYRTLDHQPFHAQNKDAWAGIDAKVNGAFIVLGLLYGEGDLDQTILCSMRCGLDSDCNPSNAAGILATTIGFNNLPEKFRAGLDATKKFSYSDYNFDDLLRVSESFTREFVIREGGKIMKDASGTEIFQIRNHGILPSKFEPAYDPGPFDGTNRYDSAAYSKILAYSYKDFAPLLEGMAPGWQLFNAGKGSKTELVRFDGREDVLAISPMSAERSAYLEYTLQKINVNDDGIEKTEEETGTGLVTFFLSAEEGHPSDFLFTVRGREGSNEIKGTINRSEVKHWKKVEVPFDITDGQLPEIKLEIQAHQGKLNNAYISRLSVSLK